MNPFSLSALPPARQYRSIDCDYRYETATNPHAALQNHTVENTDVGRKPGAAQNSYFSCNPK